MLVAKIKGAGKSLTLWFNSIMGSAVVMLPPAQESFPQLADYIPSNWYHLSMGALIVGNMVLRFKTATGLENK